VDRSIAGVSPAESTCTSCHTPLPADAQFCPRCGRATPTQISAGGTTTSTTSVEQTAEQQRRIQAALDPDYEVQRRIGSGGFAEVWAAFDRKLQRPVAVKVLHPDLVATHALLERFKREAQAVAKLRHPGVIPIYAVGEYEGLAYYIMPLVEGESLRERLTREGRLPPDEAGRILREAAAALAVAHEAGIVHRDIKPENLMLEGKERRVLVMDFGIAKSTAGTQTGLTGTGMIIGTPTYMSPEQATGSKEVDVRSDVYSLGVVGYELLTGKPPFAAPSVPELIMQHVTTPAPSVAAGRADIPESLAIAVNRCLMKEPGERWKDAGELSTFLERVATPTPQPSLVSKDLRKYARRSWRPTGRQVFWTGLGGAALVWIALMGGSPATVREALLYWRNRITRSARLAPPAESGARTARVPWESYHYSTGSVQSLGDSLLLFLTNDGESGPQLFDGKTWRTITVPGRNVPRAIITRDTVWFYSSLLSHQLPVTVVYALTRTGLAAVDTVRIPINAVWGDGTQALLATADGGILRGRPGAWHREPTGTRTKLSRIWGDARRQVALGYFAVENYPRIVVPDSLLVFNGLNWRTVDPRPDTMRGWVYFDGADLRDGTLLVAGEDCPESGMLSCRGLVARLAPGSERWQRVAAPMPEDVRFSEVVAGPSGDAWLVGDGAGCGASACLFRLTSRGLDTIQRPPSRSAVTSVAFLQGEPVAVDAGGVVWALRSGSWGVLGEVPGWIGRGRDPVTNVQWSDSTIALQGVSGVKSVVSAFGEGRFHRWTVAGGRLFEETWEGTGDRRPFSELHELPSPGGAVSAIATLGPHLIAAAPHGGVVQWKGSWEPMHGGPPDSIVGFANGEGYVGEGQAVAALGGAALWRWDSAGQRWARWHTLPRWLGRPLRFAVDPQVSSAFVVGGAGNAVLTARGEFESVQRLEGSATAVAVLDDGRAVLAYPSVDPLVDGRLVITTPLARGAVGTSPLQTPTGANLYWVGRRGCYLDGVGSGQLQAIVVESQLPFADTASGTLELPADLPAGVTVTVDGKVQPGVGRHLQVAPGQHTIVLKAKGYRDHWIGWCVSSRRTSKVIGVTMQRAPGPQ